MYDFASFFGLENIVKVELDTDKKVNIGLDVYKSNQDDNYRYLMSFIQGDYIQLDRLYKSNDIDKCVSKIYACPLSVNERDIINTSTSEMEMEYEDAIEFTNKCPLMAKTTSTTIENLEKQRETEINK